MRKEHPEGKFLFTEGLTDELLEKLKAGELDVVLAAATFKDDALKTIPLFHEPFLLTTPKNHEMAKKDPLITKDLRAEQMVLLRDGHCLADQTLALCPARKGIKTIAFHATSLETLRHLVASGMGYTLFPLLAAESDRKLGALISYTPF